MINNIELNFINKYIVKEKKERLIYEFSNLKEKAILRFSHNINCIIKRNIKINQIRVNELINIKINKMVYIISLDKILILYKNIKKTKIFKRRRKISSNLLRIFYNFYCII